MVCRLRSLWARVGDSCGRGEGVETPKSLGESGDSWLGPRAVPHAHYGRVGLIARAKLETHNPLARVVELLRSVPRVVPHAHYVRVGLYVRA